MDTHLQGIIDQLFQTYDTIGSGTLDAKEVGPFLNDAFKRLSINITVTNEQAEQSVQYIDKNADRHLTKMELYNAIKDIISKKGSTNPQSHPTAPQNSNTTGSQPNQQQNNNWQQPQQPQQPYQQQQPQHSQQQYQPQQPQQPQQPPHSQPQNNNWGQPTSNNSNQPSNNNPNQSSNNNWGQPPTNNNWNQPQPPQPHQPSNNNWNQPQPSNNNWNQPQPSNNYGGGQNNWSGSSNNDWGNTQFLSQQDNSFKRQIDQLYIRYDRDRTGSLDYRELHSAFNELLRELGINITISNHQAKKLLRAADMSEDGRIEKPEFFIMLKYLIEQQDF